MNYQVRLHEIKVQLEKEEALNKALDIYLQEKAMRQHKGRVALAEQILTMDISQLREYVKRGLSLGSKKGIYSQLMELTKSNDKYEKELGVASSDRFWSECHNYLFEDLDDEFSESEMGMTL